MPAVDLQESVFRLDSPTTSTQHIASTPAQQMTPTFGQVVNAKRRAYHMSLRDLAQLIGVHHTTIDRIEKDQFKVIDPAIIVALADVLHYDRQYFFALKGAGLADPDLRQINRAASKMSAERRAQMMQLLRETFPDCFEDVDNDSW